MTQSGFMKITQSRPVQSVKAQYPTDVTLRGMRTRVRLWHIRNAPLPMVTNLFSARRPPKKANTCPYPLYTNRACLSRVEGPIPAEDMPFI